MSTENKLLELKEMYEKGLISKDVYEQKQHSILASTSKPEVTVALAKGKSLLYKISALILVILGGIFIIHAFSDKEGKDSVNTFVTSTGIGKQVISWDERADTAARKLVERNKAVLAESIQGITHPSGKNPTLAGVTVKKHSGSVSVKMDVKWFGGFVGNEYLTSVNWSFDKSNHLIAEIVADSATVAVAADNASQLDNYFRTKIYPALKSDLGE